MPLLRSPYHPGGRASRERLDSIWNYGTSPAFTEAECAAFDFAVAAASVPNAVTDDVAAAAKRHWDEGEIVEILAVVSLFGFLNRWDDNMSTTLEDSAAEAAPRNLTGRGWTRGKHL